MFLNMRSFRSFHMFHQTSGVKERQSLPALWSMDREVFSIQVERDSVSEAGMMDVGSPALAAKRRQIVWAYGQAARRRAAVAGLTEHSGQFGS